MSTWLADGDCLARGPVEVRVKHDAVLVTGPGGLLVQAVQRAGGWDVVVWEPQREVAEGNCGDADVCAGS